MRAQEFLRAIDQMRCGPECYPSAYPRMILTQAAGAPPDEKCLYYWGLGGAAEGIRTPDPRITNALLYQLSYRGAPAQ